MSDTSKLVAYLRRFECRDRDGNYWSPQEILEAADRLEQLQGYVTTDAEEIHAKDDRIKQLEAENAKLRKYRDVMETAHGKRLYEMEMLREHFDDAGELRGDGRWRLRQIAEALKNLDEGSQLASQLFDGEYENRLKQLEAENERLRDAMERWSNAVGWKTCECRACQEFRKAVNHEQ